MDFLKSLIEGIAPIYSKVSLMRRLDGIGTVMCEEVDIENIRHVGYNKPTSTYAARFKFNFGIQEHEELYGTAVIDATFYYYQEDDSFEYEYGSEKGTHGGKYMTLEFGDVTHAELPHNEDNIELLKLPPENYTTLSSAVVKYFSEAVEILIEGDDYVKEKLLAAIEKEEASSY